MPRKQPAPSRDLVAARARFDQWRSTRKTRTRIPQELWLTAVSLARTHGVNRTARALALDYRSLAVRFASASTKDAKNAEESTTPLTFVEVMPSAKTSTMPSAPRSEYVVEFEDGRGTRMTIRASDPRDLDLASLASAFLGNCGVVDRVKGFFFGSRS